MFKNPKGKLENILSIVEEAMRKDKDLFGHLFEKKEEDENSKSLRLEDVKLYFSDYENNCLKGISFYFEDRKSLIITMEGGKLVREVKEFLKKWNIEIEEIVSLLCNNIIRNLQYHAIVFKFKEPIKNPPKEMMEDYFRLRCGHDNIYRVNLDIYNYINGEKRFGLVFLREIDLSIGLKNNKKIYKADLEVFKEGEKGLLIWEISE